MKIEEAIKQKKFKSDFHRMAVNIIYTANWLNSKHTSLLKKHSISLQQFNILRILRGQHPKPATVNLLIDRMIDKMSNASRIVDKLILKGLVERTVCPDDRRAVNVLITSKGLKLLSKLDEEMEKMEESMKTLTQKEAKQLSDLLDRLRA